MTLTGIDLTAPVIARHRVVIDGPLDIVWRLHTDIDRWPTWQQAIDSARLDGDFTPGATFAWRTYGLDICSTIHQVEPLRHTLWGGPSAGIVGIHAWTFTPANDGVLVTSEESWSGVPVDAAVAEMQAALDGSIAGWLGFLADAARAGIAAA
jgi:uncharacterized protein YndB with AHSA1/START domain